MKKREEDKINLLDFSAAGARAPALAAWLFASRNETYDETWEECSQADAWWKTLFSAPDEAYLGLKAALESQPVDFLDDFKGGWAFHNLCAQLGRERKREPGKDENPRVPGPGAKRMMDLFADSAWDARLKEMDFKLWETKGLFWPLLTALSWTLDCAEEVWAKELLREMNPRLPKVVAMAKEHGSGSWFQGEIWQTFDNLLRSMAEKGKFENGDEQELSAGKQLAQILQASPNFMAQRFVADRTSAGLMGGEKTLAHLEAWGLGAADGASGATWPTLVQNVRDERTERGARAIVLGQKLGLWGTKEIDGHLLAISPFDEDGRMKAWIEAARLDMDLAGTGKGAHPRKRM